MLIDDESLGQRLRELRGALTQQALAEAMALRGHQWTNGTVYEIERGSRKLQFREAVDVAATLHVDLTAFLRSSAEQQFANTVADLKSAWVQLREDVRRFTSLQGSARSQLERIVDAHEREIYVSDDEAARLIALELPEPLGTIQRRSPLKPKAGTHGEDVD